TGIGVLSRKPARPHPRGSARIRLEEQRILNREHVGIGLLCLCQVLEWRQVVEDIDAAAMRSENEIVGARLNLDVVHRDTRDSALELCPVSSGIEEVKTPNSLPTNSR